MHRISSLNLLSPSLLTFLMAAALPQIAFGETAPVEPAKSDVRPPEPEKKSLAKKPTTGAAPVKITHGRTLDRLEASVNSSIVLGSDIARFRKLQKLRVQLDPLLSGTIVDRKIPNTDAEIREFLINELLITQQFPVSDAEVEQEINNIQNNNHIDRATLRNALKDQGFDFDDYFELIRISASKQNLIGREIRPKVSISDTDIKNYFYNMADRNNDAGRSFHLQIISVALSSYKNTKGAYQVIDRAVADIKNGEPFEEVAKRVSDHDSAKNGGELGIFTEDQMLPSFKKQLKDLRIGHISSPFESDGRIYILKLLDLKSADSDRLNKMKDDIRNRLAVSEFQHQISLWQERQRQVSFIHYAGQSVVKELSNR